MGLKTKTTLKLCFITQKLTELKKKTIHIFNDVWYFYDGML